MKIKRLEIVGFKSFVDKTAFDFPGGIVGIVGPNGCGKSNVVDAIRWVLGEQNAKNLRGRMMEDVIFGGSESRKPHGMAEVSLVFSNDDGLGPPQYREYAEIMVTRRLFRNGESDYLINKTPCRLMDITELVMDTGVGARAYSIIEQGKIGMILNAKPEERRTLIEEAAGVTKFKNRKKTALRKIDATRQNLVRLGDIVAEVRRQMNSLKRQAQRAERFKVLREEAREIELRFAASRFAELDAESRRLAETEKQSQQTLEGSSGGLEAAELRLEQARLQQTSREKDVAAGQERVFGLTSQIQGVEGRIEFGEKELVNLDRQDERMAEERLEITRRLEDLAREEVTLKENRQGLGSDLAREEQRLRDDEALLVQHAEQEQQTSRRLEEERSALFALLTDISRLGTVQEEAQRRLEQLGERFARNTSEAVAFREQHEDVARQVQGLEATLGDFRVRRENLRQEREEQRSTLDRLRQAVEENENLLLIKREELNRMRSRLESLQQLERNLEGYGSGVRTLLKEDGFRRRFERMAADIFEAPKELEGAIEAVLEEVLQALVADKRESALEALDFLSREGGRCSFLLPGFTAAPPVAPPGAQPLVSQLKVKVGSEELVENLLGHVFVVPQIVPYLSGIDGGVTLVSHDGCVLTGRGLLTGGGDPSQGQGLLHQKREIKELGEQVEAASLQVDDLQRQREDLRARLAATEVALQETEAALHRKELKVVDSEKDLERLHQELERHTERLEVLSLEEDQLHEEKIALERQLGEARCGHESQLQKRTEQDALVTRLQEDLQRQRAELEKVREQVTTLKVTVASIREREEGSRQGLEQLLQRREEFQARLALLAGRVEEGGEEREKLKQDGVRLRQELEELYRRREEEKQRFDRLKDAFEVQGREIDALEEQLKRLRRGNNELREQLSGLQLKRRELDLEIEHLRENIHERYRVEVAELSVAEDETFDAAASQGRLEQLRRQIDQIGEVNLTAIEEFQELEERYGFLTTQQEDLRQSLEDLQKAIAKINRTTRQRFSETFEQVNENFREIFPRLFRGGRARLLLTDESDLLETGIDIEVQPPGKKLQNVTLLSGGEKALTAVALIFAIFLLKPTPFCLLDEVDAPLDDANISRFNEMVMEMAKDSQFILITHNKRTMEMAETLYGVTMEEPGVSKIVSVRMTEHA